MSRDLPQTEDPFAICIRCGTRKDEPLEECDKCGFAPKEKPDLLRSMFLSTARFGNDPNSEQTASLLEYQIKLQKGESVTYSKAELAELSLDGPGSPNLVWAVIRFCFVLLTPAIIAGVGVFALALVIRWFRLL